MQHRLFKTSGHPRNLLCPPYPESLVLAWIVRVSTCPSSVSCCTVVSWMLPVTTFSKIWIFTLEARFHLHVASQWPRLFPHVACASLKSAIAATRPLPESFFCEPILLSSLQDTALTSWGSKSGFDTTQCTHTSPGNAATAPSQHLLEICSASGVACSSQIRERWGLWTGRPLGSASQSSFRPEPASSFHQLCPVPHSPQQEDMLQPHMAISRLNCR